MATITGIVASARRQGRFDVYVDSKSAGTIGLDAIERLGLHVGRSLSEGDLAALDGEAQTLRTVDRALDMLAMHARSRRELERQLRRKGEPDDLIATAIERLTRLGVLDDASYARQFARAKLAGSGFSRRRLQSELFRRGVDRSIAEEAIAEVIADEGVDEDEQLARVAAKRLQLLGGLDPRTRQRRLFAFLARRGYDSDRIRRFLDRRDIGTTQLENE